jgi:hypothetical protein
MGNMRYAYYVTSNSEQLISGIPDCLTYTWEMQLRDSLLRWVHTITLPRTVTPYRDSVDGTRDHVTYQKLVTR